MPGLPPDGHPARAELDRATLRELAQAERADTRTHGADPTDEIPVAATRERLGRHIERYEAAEGGRGPAAPGEVGGGTWDAGKAWTFLRRHTRVGDAMLRFELDRYLGWPAQAPSYQVGERIGLELREQARAAAGAGLDLTAFHRRGLDVGSLGLDVLRRALTPETHPPPSPAR